MVARRGIQCRIKLKDRGRTTAAPCAQGQLKLMAKVSTHPDKERILIQTEGLQQVSSSAEEELLIMLHVNRR